jgi:phospholipase C
VPGRLRPTPRLLVAGIIATLAAVTVGWLALASGSTPVVPATTPIKHVVVIYDENESFDHYFGTYPIAANTPGEPAFHAAPGTPVPDNLTSANLLAPNNPNSAQPARIARANALTCDQNHGYADEQKAFNSGLMNKFVQFTAGGSCADHGIVMNYFDGNTVTALWNLAQHFTLSDNFYGTAFGPSTPGALNLIAGTTHGATPEAPGSIENGSMIADPDPAFDDCAAGSAQMAGKNVGDLLNAKGVTWGWFQGGFRRTAVSGTGKASCGSSHKNIGGASVVDYSAHHEPFMYYASTANPHHLPPTSTASIGHADQANHQYDLADFDSAVKADNLPQVSFLKAAQFEDAHPGSSDPLDEQRFVARVLDEVQQSPDWSSTAVLLTYDDSDGWYDHKQVVSQQSDGAADQAICNTPPPAVGEYKDRCGPGPRLPLLVVSPWTRANAIDHTQIEQASITRFIEENWNLGTVGDQSFDTRAGQLNPLFDFAGAGATPKVWLDPDTGTVLGAPPSGVVSSPNGTGTTTTTPPPAPPAPVTPAPTPPATTTPAPISPAPPVVKKPVIKPKLSSITVKRSGKKVTVKLKVTGLSTKGGKVTLSAKLVQKRKTVATSATGTVKAGKATLTVKAKKTIKKGKYTLSVKVKQGTATATVTKAVTLK